MLRVVSLSNSYECSSIYWQDEDGSVDETSISDTKQIHDAHYMVMDSEERLIVIDSLHKPATCRPQ